MQNIKSVIKLLILVVAMFVGTMNVAVAGEIPFITTEELKKKFDAGDSFTLADALSSIEHKELSIKGAVNIPAGKVKGHPDLPADKSSLLIFYCKGPKCGKSRIAAEKAIEEGYTNVMVYNEGLPAWAKSKYPLEKKLNYPDIEIARMTPQEVQAALASVVLLDIRGQEHREMGVIPSAVNIVLDDMEEKYATLPKDKKIIVTDHAGKQTAICAKFLYMNGYEDVAVMDGGVTAWMRAGLPVDK